MKTNNIDYQIEESPVNEKDSYVPPRIEVIEVSVEKGFADSTTDYSPGNW